VLEHQAEQKQDEDPAVGLARVYRVSTFHSKQMAS
jgi:hypothetical protein